MSKLTYRQVRQEYLKTMDEHIELQTGSTKSEPAVVMDMLGLAAVNRSSLHSACASVAEAPTSAAILYQLRQGWLQQTSLAELEAELNELLVARLPGGLRGKRQPVAIDLTYLPYHGEAQADDNEIRRAAAQSGTTHFHVYASAYLLCKQKRVTVAVAYCRADVPLLTLLQRLLRRLDTLGLRPKRLLLDRHFCSVPIVRFLQSQPWQTILPVPARSHQLKTLKAEAPHSQHLSYTMTSPQAGTVTFPLHVVCRYARGRRGKHGIDRLLFAVLGQPWQSTPARLADTYRRRFGIETSYRLMNSLRIRTSSRDPKLRLLFVVLAFLLVNLWIFLAWSVLAVPRRGGRWLLSNYFRLDRFRLFLRHAIHTVRPPIRSITHPSIVF